MTTRFEIGESVRHYYGQVLQSSLDPDHHVETGRPLRVYGNLADRLAGSRHGDHFQVSGDNSRHSGLFDCAPESGSESAKADGACC